MVSKDGLLKKYIDENGSGKVDDLLFSTDQVYVSIIAKIESFSTLKRLLTVKEITPNDYQHLKYEIEEDFRHYTQIDLDSEIILMSISAIEKQQLKSQDSIHLGSALCRKERIDFFVSCNGKLLSAAAKENLEVVNPNK